MKSALKVLGKSLFVVPFVMLLSGGPVMFGRSASVSLEQMRQTAAAALERGDFKTAAALYKDAIDLEPRNSALFAGLGRAYERMAESASFPLVLNRKAKTNYHKALDLDPRNVQAMHDLIELSSDPAGVCYGDLAEANNLAEKIATIDPNLGAEEKVRVDAAVSNSKTPEMIVRCPQQAFANVDRLRHHNSYSK